MLVTAGELIGIGPNDVTTAVPVAMAAIPVVRPRDVTGNGAMEVMPDVVTETVTVTVVAVVVVIPTLVTVVELVVVAASSAAVMARVFTIVLIRPSHCLAPFS